MAPTSAIGNRPRRMLPVGGFTLLEMVVVLAILALMASLVPVALNRMLPARRLALTTERLVTDIRWLQAQATASGSTAQLVITSTGYVLRVPSLGTERRVDVPEPIEVRQLLRPGAGPAQLAVHPEGTTSGGDFEVRDSRRRQRVEVSMLTGKVRRMDAAA